MVTSSPIQPIPLPHILCPLSGRNVIICLKKHDFYLFIHPSVTYSPGNNQPNASKLRVAKVKKCCSKCKPLSKFFSRAFQKTIHPYYWPHTQVQELQTHRKRNLPRVMKAYLCILQLGTKFSILRLQLWIWTFQVVDMIWRRRKLLLVPTHRSKSTQKGLFCTISRFQKAKYNPKIPQMGNFQDIRGFTMLVHRPETKWGSSPMHHCPNKYGWISSTYEQGELVPPASFMLWR